MKTSKILLPIHRSIEEETPKTARVGKFLMFMVIIFTISLITLIYSCAVFIPAPGPIGPVEHHGHGENFGHAEHHDHGEHHD